MDILTIYAIAVGGIFTSLVIIRVLKVFAPWSNAMNVFICQHLAYPYVLGRHSLLGPWTRAGVFLHLIYLAINLLLLFLNSISMAAAGRRAGTLSLFNMIFLLASWHLSNLADILGISLRIYRRMHRAAGWVVVALVLFHVFAMLQGKSHEDQEINTGRLSAIIGAGCLCSLVGLSLPFCRRLSYELFLRLHQALAVASVYGIWRHLPSEKYSSRFYLYIALGIMGCTSIFHLILLLYRNGLFSGNGCPRVISIYHTDERGSKNAEQSTKTTPIRVRLILPRPVKAMAGQYINLWLPSLGLLSWAQTHPFIITSWSRTEQGVLDLLVEPRGGLTKTLVYQAHAAPKSNFSSLALYSGPHGISECVDKYESVLLVASGAGIAAIIPYAKKLIHGYNTCTSHVRRMHLIWQVESLDVAISMQGLLNDLLKDDVLDDGYILAISVYVGRGLLSHEKLPFGKHDRAFIYQGTPDYSIIIPAEVSGEKIERLPNIRDERGRMLLITSASARVRDNLRHIARGYLHQRLQMLELEYQP